MTGKRVMAEPVFSTVRIDDYLPANHLLRAVDALLDTAFVRRIMAPHYSLIGRPSIDPELMIRMLLIGYLGGIRSERNLCAGMRLNLAHRWFCRLGVDDVVPNHSTFSKNRHRRFRDGNVFRAVFEQVVRCCVEAGLVPGESAAVDGSQVDADASRHKRLPGGRVPEAWTTDRKAQSRPVREHLDALDAAVPPGPDEPRHEAPKYLSPTDSTAAWSIKHGVGVFAYETNLLVDTAHGIIVDVEATPARLSQEIVAAKAMLARAEAAFGFAPSCLGADKSYGTGPFLAWLLAHGVDPHIPVLDRTAQTEGMFTRESFTYLEAEDAWYCPSGHTLRLAGFERSRGIQKYSARAVDCGACALKPRRTTGKARGPNVSIHEPARKAVQALAGTTAYVQSQRWRQKIEILFAHLKQQFRIRRLWLRGSQGAAEEFHLAAAVQNLRRLARLTVYGLSGQAGTAAFG